MKHPFNKGAERLEQGAGNGAAQGAGKGAAQGAGNGAVLLPATPKQAETVLMD